MRSIRSTRTRSTLTRSLSAVVVGALFSLLFLAAAATLHAGYAQEDACTRMGGLWQDNGTVCVVADLWTTGGGLHVPATMTLAVAQSFLNDPTIIGPGPGVLTIDPVTVDGRLVISGAGENYGPVTVNGRLTISGTWTDLDETRYVCDEIRDICVYSSVHGHLRNAGDVDTHGIVLASFGLVNQGQWRNHGALHGGATVDNDGALINSGEFHAGGTLHNRGLITGSGAVTLTGRTLNAGMIHSSGRLVNQGELYNWGTLSGNVINQGVIYSTGELSASISGDGPVHLQPEALYLPQIR